MKKPGIIAVHLLNDFSGSPLVFREALQALQENGYAIRLFTATPSGKGFLSDLPGVECQTLSYRWSKYKLLTLCYFLLSQISLFFRVLWHAGREDIVYVNSMLPFGAALAGWLKGSIVVYHIHEVSITPILLRKWLLFVINRTAVYCIYVSDYLRKHTPIGVPGEVIYNCLPTAFVEKCRDSSHRKKEPVPAFRTGENRFIILMLCSMKSYKGVHEFVHCARALPEIRFNLVLNANRQDIDDFFAGSSLPPNLRLYDAQSDTHPFYENADVVVNLSLPDQWVETFGMTVLEGMYYGKPVIVPPVGGVSELVEDGVNGFSADSRNVADLIGKIRLLSCDRTLYERMSLRALEKAKSFRQEIFGRSVSNAIHKLLKNRIYEEEKNRSHRYGGHTG